MREKWRRPRASLDFTRRAIRQWQVTLFFEFSRQQLKPLPGSFNFGSNYGVTIVVASSSILVAMFPPNVRKASTQANATSAAATAYSESSRPVSSFKNLLIILLAP